MAGRTLVYEDMMQEAIREASREIVSAVIGGEITSPLCDGDGNEIVDQDGAPLLAYRKLDDTADIRREIAGAVEQHNMSGISHPDFLLTK